MIFLYLAFINALYFFVSSSLAIFSNSFETKSKEYTETVIFLSIFLVIILSRFVIPLLAREY